MALRYYKTTGVQPQSQFVPLPLDFIYKQGLEKQAKQEAMQGELSKMGEIYKDLKYVQKDDPAAQALQNELQANVDELINTYDGDLSSGSATRDYQRLASKWRGDQRALNLQRNYTELQGINEMLAKDKDNMPYNQLAQLNERKKFLERGTYGTPEGNIDFSQDPNLVQNVGVTGYSDVREGLTKIIDGLTASGYENKDISRDMLWNTMNGAEGVTNDKAYKTLLSGYSTYINSLSGQNLKNQVREKLGREPSEQEYKSAYVDAIASVAEEATYMKTKSSRDISGIGDYLYRKADEKKESELDVYPLTNQYTQPIQINPEESSWLGALSNKGIISRIMLPKLLEDAYDKFGDKGVQNLENYINKNYSGLFEDVNMYKAKKDMYKKKGINIDVGEKYFIKSAGLENQSQENQDKSINEYLKEHNKSLLSDTEMVYNNKDVKKERSIILFGSGYNNPQISKMGVAIGQPVLLIGNDGKIEQLLNKEQSDKFWEDVKTAEVEGKVQDKSPLNGLYQNNNGLPISGEFFNYRTKDDKIGRAVVGGTEPEREKAARYNLINKLLLNPFGSNYYGKTENPAFVPTDNQSLFLTKGSNFKNPIKYVYLRRNPISKAFEFWGEDSNGKQDILNINDKTLGVSGTGFDSEDALQILERLKQ